MLAGACAVVFIVLLRARASAAGDRGDIDCARLGILSMSALPVQSVGSWRYFVMDSCIPNVG